MADTEYINENDLIAQLGVCRQKLRKMRPEGFVLHDSDGALWPMADATQLAIQMGVELCDPEKNAPEIEILTVASIRRGNDGRHFPNKNIIMARRPCGEIVTVRVINSSNFQPTLRITGSPMTFRAKKSSGNWWQFMGKEPRYPGQW